MFKKKLLALGLSLAMVASIAACGSDDKKENNSENTPAATQSAESTPAGNNEGKPTEAPAKEDEPTSAAADHSSIAAGSIVDFEDGNSSFLVLNEADWGRDKGSEVSIADAFGSKMLQVTRPNGLNPSIAIDIVGLLGDNASKCAKISVDLGLKNDVFGAASGSVLVYAGETNTEIAQTYSIYKITAACKTVEIDLGGNTLVEGNYLTFGKVTDGGAKPSSILVDNIIFYDASGNALPIDSSVSFAVNGVGEYDWSNGTVQPVDEELIMTGVATGTGWWPDGGNSFQTSDETESSGFKYLDPAKFGPGTVITVYYNLADPEKTDGWQSAPYIRMQNWTAKDADGNDIADDGSGWNAANAVDVQPHNFDLDGDGQPDMNEDGSGYGENFACNLSKDIVQFYFEDFQAGIKAVFPDITDEQLLEWTKYADMIGVADKGVVSNIKAITIGKVPQ